MQKQNLTDCFKNKPLILTEGAIGLRLAQEFHIQPDEHIKYAGLIYDSNGRKALKCIYNQYLQIAQEYALPILLLCSTRRANRENMQKSAFRETDVMRDYAEFLHELAKPYHCDAYIGGVLGCKGDAYKGDEGLSVEEAQDFHTWQVNMFINTKIDFLYACLMPTLSETVGMAKAIEKTDFPYIISFMIRKQGTMLDGNTIHDAIWETDRVTNRNPLCYITNCVHPTILREALNQSFNNTKLVHERFQGIMANASCLAPEELDNIQEVKTTEAEDLANDIELLHNDFPMKIYGGCCGTNHTHIEEIARRMRKI